MFRCRHFVMAALIVVGSVPLAVRQPVCAGAEPLPADAGVDPDLWIPESLAHDPAEIDSMDAEPEWPPYTEWPRSWEIGPKLTMRLRGRVDTDAIGSGQTDSNKSIFGDVGNAAGLRRARLGVEGELGPDSRYVAEIDLASGSVVPRDVYAAFGNRQERVEAQLGHFREPFSLEGGTSARYFAFMERSPINLLDPARNWGAGLFHEELTTGTALALGLFHSGSNASDLQGGDGSTVGTTGRVTAALINEGNGETLFHLGLALSERVPENGVILINQQPQSPLLDLGDSSTTPFVPALRIPARFQQLINLQLAAARGPLWTQAEWYGSFIDQTGGGSVFFRGFHADVGYFLTGEHREYDSASGVLGAIHVNRPVLGGPVLGGSVPRGSGGRGRERGWGAWELTARFAYLNFLDPDTPLQPNGQQPGIQLSQPTLGVNWYLSDRVRLMFNYSYAIPLVTNADGGVASIFGTRLAVFW